MKAILPWFLVIALAAALAWQYNIARQQHRELTSTRFAVEQLEVLRQESEARRQEHAGVAAALERERAGNKDLLRLRGEVAQLRKDRDQLTRQLQTVQSQALAQRQTQSAPTGTSDPFFTAASMEAQARFRQRYGLPLSPEQQQLNDCVNNLRQIDGAKEQWALENRQAQGAPADASVIKPYLKEMPVCPAGGSYTIGAIGTLPVCTTPGHALPQPTPAPPK
jgi:hypothetical protein